MSLNFKKSLGIVLVAVLVVTPASAWAASISLEFRPLNQTVGVGDMVGVGLYAVSVTGQDEDFNSAQVVLTWDTSYLTLMPTDQTGAVLQPPNDTSTFLPGDGFGLNESNPPADGDGLWYGLVALGEVRQATTSGSLLATLMFEALAEIDCTNVSMLASMQKPGRPMAETKINQATSNVLDQIGGPACIEIVPEPGTLSLLALAGVAVMARRRK